MREEKITKSVLFRVYKTYKKEYSNWLFESKSQKYSESVLLALNSLFKNKDINENNITKCIQENKYSDKYSIIAFRSFLRYCENNELIDFELLHKLRNKVKINIKSSIDSYVPLSHEIIASRNLLIHNYPQFLVLYDFLIESGARFTELKEFILKFNETNIEIINNIVIFRNFYIRGKKSSYYLFFTLKTYNTIKNNINNIDLKLLNSFQNITAHKKEYLCIKYLRKYNFTLMIENNISLEIANFIQGRASNNVGFNHYLAKKTIAVREYEKIINLFY